MKWMLMRGLALCLTGVMLVPLFASCAKDVPETPDTSAPATEDTSDTSDTIQNNSSTPDPTEEPDTPEYPVVSETERYLERTLSLTDKKVAKRIKADGRSYVSGKGMTLDWSAAALEFRADCEGTLKVELYAALEVTVKVYVDGEYVKTLILPEAQFSEHTLAPYLTKGEHTVRLLRITKVEFGNVGATADLCNITLSGVLKERPADKQYMIEFVGDSVTSGVGTRMNDTAAYGDETYAYQTAQCLGTDYSIVSVPGIGTLTSTSRHNGLNISTVYDKYNYYRSFTPAYEPERQADLVVFATNANDPANSDATAFKSQIRTLVAKARRTHGNDTKFIWVFNMYNNKDATLNQYVKDVFAEYGGEAAGFYTLSFYVDNSGGDVHPSGAAHDDYTDLLVNFIQSKNILR
ncbi:MAG: hypothetical protein IJW44_03600 [Clostridia bacterium]|nr:hypothetical protein [Clostridia bacterium]